MLGRVQQARGDLEAAEPMLRRAYDLQIKLSGELSDETVNARNGLAELLVVRGKTDEAESLLRRNVDAVRKIYGKSNATLGIAWNNLANALSDIPARYGEAEKAYLEAIRILEASLEPGHPRSRTPTAISARYISRRASMKRRQREHTIALKLRLRRSGRNIQARPHRAWASRSRKTSWGRAPKRKRSREVKTSFAGTSGRITGARPMRSTSSGSCCATRQVAEALAEVKPAQAILLASSAPITRARSRPRRR